MPSWRSVRLGPLPRSRPPSKRRFSRPMPIFASSPLNCSVSFWGRSATVLASVVGVVVGAPTDGRRVYAISTYGDADDVPLAAEHLGKIIRRKSSISWEPPRGNEIITLLVRHRDLPEAQAALADLTKCWPKLPEELQALVAANTTPISCRRSWL